MRFKDIVGQERAKEKLLEGIRNQRISHAQLFCGNSGYGGLPLAIAYAQYISCQDKQDGDSCGKCNSCIKFEKLVHPDLHFSFPFNKNDQIKHDNVTSDDFLTHWRKAVLANPYLNLDQWHQEIQIANKQSLINVKESQSIIKKLSLKAYESEFKFLIIWKAEKMNPDAANKLLKLIEEPSPKTVIILLAEDEEALLKTITSRTQILTIPPLKESEIAKHLLSLPELSENKAKQIASHAEGNLNTALHELMTSQEDDEFFDLFKNWMRVCYKADIQGMHAWVEEISKAQYGREKRKRFLLYALNLMRESILRQYVNQDLQRFYGEENNFLQKFAPFIHENNILGISEVLSEAHQHISRNGYAKIIFMDMSMKFANLLRIKKRTFVN